MVDADGGDAGVREGGEGADVRERGQGHLQSSLTLDSGEKRDVPSPTRQQGRLQGMARGRIRGGLKTGSRWDWESQLRVSNSGESGRLHSGKLRALYGPQMHTLEALKGFAR